VFHPEHAVIGPCLSCTEDSTSRCSAPDEASLVHSRGSPPSSYWPCVFVCSPGYGWLSGLQGHIAGSCTASQPPVLPGPFWRTVLHPYIPQLVLVMGIATTKVLDLAVDFVQPHELLLGPLLRPV